VGFPGETQEDIDLLTAYMEALRFDRLGAFSFSPEEGTAAEKMPDQVPEGIKAERLERVMRLQAQISLEQNRLRIGSTETLLVTGRAGGRYLARSQWEAPDSDGLIAFPNPRGQAKEGEFVRVRMTGAQDYDLQACLIKEDKTP